MFILSDDDANGKGLQWQQWWQWQGFATIYEGHTMVSMFEVGLKQWCQFFMLV
jgi:hypothetical protein